MLELIHDLGDCEDSRQVLITATRHMRVLFGDYWVAALIVDDPGTDRWWMLPLENPYEPSWGGIPHHMLPPKTETDEICRQIGRDVHSTLMSEGVLTRGLVDGAESFVSTDNPLAMRLAAMTGSPCRTFMGACWKRPQSARKAWMVLGYPEPVEVAAEALKLYETTVSTMAKMAAYPALVSYIDRAERLNQSVRRNIVHDLKTPLTVIKGYMQTLMEGGETLGPEMTEELSAGIIESCDRLLEDIKDLLEPVGHAWTPQISRFDLSALVNKVVLAERHTDRAKGRTIDVAGGEAAVWVEADFRKIRRVVENLLSNAVKYSPGEGNRIWVEVVTFDGHVTVSVRDEGIGMDDVQLAKVMNEAGRVVDPALGIEGTGFGLSSTRTVVEAHGGRLMAESCVGVGSTFRFELPLRPD